MLSERKVKIWVRSVLLHLNVNLQKKRNLAVWEMCKLVSNRDKSGRQTRRHDNSKREQTQRDLEREESKHKFKETATHTHTRTVALGRYMGVGPAVASVGNRKLSSLSTRPVGRGARCGGLDPLIYEGGLSQYLKHTGISRCDFI